MGKTRKDSGRKPKKRKAATSLKKGGPIINILLYILFTFIFLITLKLLILIDIPANIITIYLVVTLSYIIYKIENDNPRFDNLIHKLYPKLK